MQYRLPDIDELRAFVFSNHFGKARSDAWSVIACNVEHYAVWMLRRHDEGA